MPNSTALTRKRDAAIEEAGPDAVYGWVSEGLSIREVANELGLDGTDQNVRWSVRNWLRRDEDRYNEAKAASVDALAERAYQIYGDEAPETTADGTWRDRKAGHLRWLADLRAGRNKDGVNVNLSVNELHLDALRKKGHMPRPKGEVQDAEYEVLEEAPQADASAQEGYPSSVTGKGTLGDLPDS
jgi:hypothetical protein